MKLSVFASAMVAAAGLTAASPVAAPAPAAAASNDLPLSPTKVKERDTTICGQWDTVTVGAYNVAQNLWGEKYATSGSQCTNVTGLVDDKLVWSTTWEWAGEPTQVKSFANALVSHTTKQLSDISEIPTTWEWSYTGTEVLADVAYDLFTAASSSGTAEYEIMIWLGRLGDVNPLGEGSGTIATPEIGGITWDLYKGTNEVQTVFSFIAPTNENNFSGDLNNFISYLTTNEGLPKDQYLTSIGAGTETFTGSNAVFKTLGYSASQS